MNPLTYLKHVREEFAHIVWPSNHTAVSHTLVVILIAIAVGVVVALADYLFSGIVSSIVGG